MESDDEVNEETSFDPTFATAGPRRSTFTPPPGSTATPPPTPAIDDDELANALAADLGRLASGPVPVTEAPAAPVADAAPAPETPPASTVAPSADEDEVVDDVADVPEPVSFAPVFSAPAPEPVRPEPTVFDLDADIADASAPAAEPIAAAEPVAAAAPVAAAPPVGAAPADFEFAPPPAPDTIASADAVEPPPWSSLPAPDPTQAVELPEGPPQRPIRRSVPTEELLTIGADQDAGSRIEQLEAQLRLREQEAREFSAWESSMLALGTPDATAAVEEARGDFTDVVAPPTGAIPVHDFSAVFAPVAEPDPVPAPEAFEPVFEVPVFEPEPVVEAEPVVQPVAEPEPVEPEPEPVVDETPMPFPAYEPPTVTNSIPVVAAAAYEVLDEDEADVTPEVAPPTPALPSWEVPAPSATWDPEPWEPVLTGPVFTAPTVEDVVEAEAAEPEVIDAEIVEPEVVEPEVVEPEVVEAEVVEPEPEPDFTEPEPLAEPVSPFAPPPLVEPPPFGGPPILPSEAAAMPPLVDAVPEFEPVADSGASDVLVAEVVDEPATAAPFAFGTAPAAPVDREFSFDDLLTGASDEEPPLRRDPEPAAAAAVGAESLFIEPMPVSAGERVPTETGSVAIVEPAYEEELDDDVDETDRVPTVLGAAAVAGAATLPPPISPPSGPISTVRIPEDQTVLVDNEPVSPPVLRVEQVGLEPTPLDQRVGRAARLFWLWFAANSSVVSLGLGATVFAVGMSLRQSIVAVLAGVALSFIPLGLSTLAGKRSGQPTMVVSRATFGHLGNIIPTVIALLGRVFWGAVLLWLIASSIAVVLVGGKINGPLGEVPLLLISLAAAFVVAVLVAFTGYALIARIQLILSILSAVLVVGFIALTVQYVDVAQALTVPDGSWLLAVTGAVLVFSVVGLVWANSGADLARYQRPGAGGPSTMLWATFGATLPSFVLIAYGALLAASDPGIASGFVLSPLDTLARMLPLWYPIPLLAATTLSLLSGVVITLYSGGFALQALGARVARQWSVLIVAAILGVLAVVIALGFTGGMGEVFRDAATTLAVPTAAWAGIFAAETMIRNRRFESQSLVQRGGVYPDWRWGNLIGFVVITVIGFGLTTATVSWLGWQGFLFTALGVPLDSDLAGTDGGVLVTLLLGILLPIVIGIPAIRKQEETRVP